MAEYINKARLREAMYHESFEKDSELQRWDNGCWIRYKLFENVIDSIPAADVQPVVHGKWEETMDAHIGIDYLCSACRKLTHTAKQYDIYGNEYVYEFCPHCGARMDGET